jgi:hypothetical protein
VSSFDEEQHVQASQPDRVDGEEVARHDPDGLLAQERPPGRGHPPWRGIQPPPTQDGADGGGRDLDAEALEFTLDALVAPAWVLPGQADDQLLHPLVHRWSSGLVVRVGPGTGDQASVPAQQRLRRDEEAGPVGPGQDAADRGQQRPVSGLELGSWCLASEHGELVAQNEDLQILGGIAAGEQGEQPDGAAQRQVSESWEHRAATSAMGQGRVRVPATRRLNPQATARSEFLHPTGRQRGRSLVAVRHPDSGQRPGHRAAELR